MAFTNQPYCTLADVKSAMGTTITTDDAWINTLITQAQAEIDSELGYSFQTDGTLVTPAIRYYDGNNADSLLIDRIVSVAQVIEIAYNTVLGVRTLSSPTDITSDVVLGPYYNAAPYFMLKRLSLNPFYAGKRNYKVSGVFGYYDVGVIPADIQRACTLLVIHYYRMRDVGYSSVAATSGPNQFTQRYSRGIPDDIMGILGRYRRRNFFTTGV